MSNCDADTFIVNPMNKAEIARKRQESWQKFAAYWRHTLLPVSVQDDLIAAAKAGRGISEFQRLRLIEAVIEEARLNHPKFFK